MAAKSSGHSAEYVMNEMPMAHAVQWQAFYLQTREFSAIELTYPQYAIDTQIDSEIESICHQPNLRED